VIDCTTETGFAPASWTWTVIEHVEPGVLLVVGEFMQVLAVIASWAGGPPVPVTVAVFEPEMSPVDAAVTTQDPGTPAIVSVTVVAAAPTKIVLEFPKTLQTALLSTDHVTVVDAMAPVAMPFASRSVAVAETANAAPPGKADCGSETVS
jgi:hypothetical protein